MIMSAKLSHQPLNPLRACLVPSRLVNTAAQTCRQAQPICERTWPIACTAQHRAVFPGMMSMDDRSASPACALLCQLAQVTAWHNIPYTSGAWAGQ